MITSIFSITRHVPTLTFLLLSIWMFLLSIRDITFFELSIEEISIYSIALNTVMFILLIFFIHIFRYWFLPPQTTHGERSWKSYWTEAREKQNVAMLEHLKMVRQEMESKNFYRLWITSFLFLLFINFLSEGTTYQFVQDHLFLACLLSFPITLAFLIALMRNEGDETTIYIPSSRPLRVD